MIPRVWKKYFMMVSLIFLGLPLRVHPVFCYNQVAWERQNKIAYCHWPAQPWYNTSTSGTGQVWATDKKRPLFEQETPITKTAGAIESIQRRVRLRHLWFAVDWLSRGCEGGRELVERLAPDVTEGDAGVRDDECQPRGFMKHGDPSTDSASAVSCLPSSVAARELVQQDCGSRAVSLLRSRGCWLLHSFCVSSRPATNQGCLCPQLAPLQQHKPRGRANG